MKNTCSILLGIIFLVFVCSSCTMEKRVYRPGYHLEWNSAKHKSKTDELIPIAESVSVIEKKADKQEASIQIESGNDFINNEAVTASMENTPVIFSKKISMPVFAKMGEIISQRKESSNRFRHKRHASSNEEKKSSNPLPIIGISLGGVSLIFFLIGVALDVTLGGFLFEFAGVLMGIGGLVMSMIGLRKAVKKKEKNSSKVIALVGLICSAIGMLLCIIGFWALYFTLVFSES